MTNIKIIIGSTRPNRFGIKPATWIHQLTKKQKNATFELIDLQEVGLPLLDEPNPPAMQKYQKEHTKAWSKVINEADGFIIVTPEYNHGMPAALKNAIDFLVPEWAYKPVAFVGYGAEAGGARAIEQLRQVAAWLKMYDLADHVIIPNYWTQLDKDGSFRPSDVQTIDAERLISSVAVWAEAMKPVREKIANTK